MVKRDEPAVEFEAIVHEFEAPGGGAALRVLDGISLGVRQGQFVALLGPSGCGKSTLLRMAAGLITPSRGRVRQQGTPILALNRTVGLVPQQAQLLPWKTLHENVELPLLFRRIPEEERRRRVREMLRSVGLEGFERHYPQQLSGGMQKRAAIARTLIYAPQVVLMDEPFGALDAQTRMLMQHDLQRLCARERTTVIFVTHDLTEAVLLADVVVLLSRPPTIVKAVVPIGLERPRNVFQPFHNAGFTADYDRIWAIFRDELAAPEPPRAEAAAVP